MKLLHTILASALVLGIVPETYSLGETGLEGSNDQRYRDEIFSSVEVKKDIAYGQAVNTATGKNETLRLDLYQPGGDAAQQRPAVIWIHGGGFRSGKDKSDEKVKTLSNRFAKRGYVAASINYRLAGGLNIEAGTMAYEDAKAAVRWLRANAETYRIDVNRIAVGGTSAGAVAAIHATYEEAEGNSGNPGYSSEISACIDMSGAGQAGIIDAGEAPLNIIHGTADASAPFVFATQLQQRAQQVGVPVELHAIQGGGHDIWGSNQDEMVQWNSDFLYTYMIDGIPTAVAERASNLPQSIDLSQNYPNPVSLSKHLSLEGRATTSIRYSIFSAGVATLQVFNAIGQEIATLASGWHEPGIYTRDLVATGLPAGIYFYRLQAANAVIVKKMLLTK